MKLAGVAGAAGLLVLAATLAGLAATASGERCTLEIAPGADLQQALEDVSADREPATLCLRAGEFRLARFLSITRDHVAVRGEGASTVVRLEDGIQSPVIVVGDYRHHIPTEAVSDVTIERLRIIGGDGGDELHATYPHLTNSAVMVRAGQDVRLRDLEVSRCRSACILTEYDTRDVAIERNLITGSTWDGISLNRTSRARLAGNTLRGNTAAGITTEHLEESVIEDNAISGNGSHGIYLSDSHRNRFRRNGFSGNTSAGVFLTCAVRYRDPGPVLCWDDSMSRGNTFEDNAFVGNRLGYIVAADDAANCRRPGTVPNVSRSDRFLGNPSIEQNAAAYGECLWPAEPFQG